MRDSWTNHVEPAAFSALTASTGLHELWVWVDRRFNTAQQAGVWQHVFAPSRVLPALRNLTLQVSTPAYPIHLANVVNGLGTADVERLVSCCPALQRLSLTVKPDVQLHAMLSLTQLQRLCLLGIEADAPKRGAAASAGRAFRY